MFAGFCMYRYLHKSHDHLVFLVMFSSSDLTVLQHWRPLQWGCNPAKPQYLAVAFHFNSYLLGLDFQFDLRLFYPDWWRWLTRLVQDFSIHVCQGLNSHYFHIIGDGHQPNSRGLYTHYKDSVIKGGRSPIPNKTRQPWPWHIYQTRTSPV